MIRNTYGAVSIPLMTVQTSIGAVIAFSSPPFVIDHMPALQPVSIYMILVVDVETPRVSIELTGLWWDSNVGVLFHESLIKQGENDK